MAEKEYIEREAAIESIRLTYCKECNSYNGVRCRACEFDDAMLMVEDVPAADVVEVVHAEWIIKTNYKTPVSHAYIRKEKLYICPYCGKDYRQNMNFCGNCGVRMDGGKHETD